MRHLEIHFSTGHLLRLLTTTFLLLATVEAHAQPALEARLGGRIESFAGEPAGSEDRTALEGGLGLEYAFDAARGRLFYGLDAERFGNPGDWSSFLHEAGAAYRLDLARERARLHVRGSASWRRNGAAWAEADYRQFTGMLNAELVPARPVTLRLGYRLDVRRFAEITALDQTEQEGFLSLLVNLPSRTTLVGETRLGSKAYREDPVAAENLALFRAGRSRGLGPVLRGPAGPAAPSGARARAWSGLLRAAQSLGDRTGARIQGSWRHTWGAAPPAVVTTPQGFVDDGVYDDPYASEAGRLLVALKHVFPGGAFVEGSGSWERRDYTALPALAANGSPRSDGALRRDRALRASLTLDLPLGASGTGEWLLDLVAGYQFTRQTSSEAFYEYRVHAVRLALSLER